MADPLPPGGELDRRVAEVVFGWERVNFLADGSLMGYKRACTGVNPRMFDDLREVKCYSTDPTANAEVLEWIEARSGWDCQYFRETDLWQVMVGPITVTGDSQAHAFCLAALRVAEEERAAKAEAESLTAAGFRHGTPADFMATGESVVAQLNRLTDERDEARQQAERLQAELKRVQAERDDYAERMGRVVEAVAGE